MKLLGKKALIIGAAAGIGRAIAARFVKEGASVACVDIDSESLDTTVRALQGGPGTVSGMSADVGIQTDIEHIARYTFSQLQGLDILVNNAGINAGGSLDTVTLADWNRAIAVNLTSMFLLSKEVWVDFARQGYGVILNMSSIMEIGRAHV